MGCHRICECYHGFSEQDLCYRDITRSKADGVSLQTPLEYIFQYTSYAFGWTAETVSSWGAVLFDVAKRVTNLPVYFALQVSYYLTLHGITQAIFLSLILPGQYLR
jgi:hypothetical protein